MNAIKINKEQKLYITPCGRGYYTLGFEVCYRRLYALAKELNYKPVSIRKGTIKMYNEYISLIELARKKNEQTGWRSNSQLIPEFIGNEGRRVEVVNSYGETERYYIGKSSGFIPCHLQISKSNSTGGMAVTGYPFKSINFLS